MAARPTASGFEHVSWSRRARLALALFALVGLAVAPGAALAQSPSDLAMAESLFTEGRRLMEEKKYTEACPKLEESYRIDPAQGTLLNLAVCHEEQGRIATAWGEFKSAYSLARKDGREDRARLAQEHIDAIEPRLPKVRINVPKESQVPGLVVTRNGSEVKKGGWGVLIAVDPGQLEIKAEAPEYHAWTKVITIEEKQTASIVVPPLKPAPKPPEPKPPESKPGQTSEQPVEPPTNLRPLGWAIGGLGLVGVGVGTFFGLQAIDKTDQYDAACPTPDSGPRVCDREAEELYGDASDAAAFSTIGFVAGGVFLAAGVTLLVIGETGGGPAGGDSGVALKVNVGPGTANLSGSF